jgi:hypothetical protein
MAATNTHHQYRDIPLLTNFEVSQIQTYTILFKKAKENEETFLKCGTDFSLCERKRKETKATEEYCWAITQAGGRSSCGRL